MRGGPVAVGLVLDGVRVLIADSLLRWLAEILPMGYAPPVVPAAKGGGNTLSGYRETAAEWPAARPAWPPAALAYRRMKITGRRRNGKWWRVV